MCVCVSFMCKLHHIYLSPRGMDDVYQGSLVLEACVTIVFLGECTLMFLKDSKISSRRL